MVNLLKGLPILIIANIILGAEYGRLKQEFDKEILLSGLFKGLVVYVAIGLIVIATNILPQFEVAFNGENMDLISAINLLLYAEVVWYGGQVLSKFIKIAKHTSEASEILIDEGISEEMGEG